MHIYAVIPVARYEPESVITKSIECLRGLECDDFNLEVYYVIETFQGDKRNLHWTLPDNFKLMLRAPRGRKAGALNDFLSVVKKADYSADYVAIFDVDSRPTKNFIVKCVAALEKCEDDSAVVSQGCRVINNKSNFLTKIASIESDTACEINQLSSRLHTFLLFSGPIVIRGSFLYEEKFNEEASGETFDMLVRMYVKGKFAVLAKTTLREQAPTTLKDLYNQRVRWYKGAVESFSRYLIPMVKAPIPLMRKISYFLFITFSISQFLLIPAIFTRLDKILKVSDSSLEFVKLLVGSIGCMLFMTICGLVAVKRHVLSSKPEWKPTTRSDV